MKRKNIEISRSDNFEKCHSWEFLIRKKSWISFFYEIFSPFSEIDHIQDHFFKNLIISLKIWLFFEKKYQFLNIWSFLKKISSVFDKFDYFPKNFEILRVIYTLHQRKNDYLPISPFFRKNLSILKKFFSLELPKKSFKLL